MLGLVRKIVVTALVVAGVVVLRTRMLDADDARTGFGAPGGDRAGS